jgi:hypothetical protein
VPCLAQVPLGQVVFGGGVITFGGAETTLEGGGTEVDGGETGAGAVLFAGTTGEVCFTGPPTTIGLFLGPPTEFCAWTGLENAQRTTKDITAPLFTDASFQAILTTEDRLRTPLKIDYVPEHQQVNPIDFPYRFAVVMIRRGTQRGRDG